MTFSHKSPTAENRRKRIFAESLFAVCILLILLICLSILPQRSALSGADSGPSGGSRGRSDRKSVDTGSRPEAPSTTESQQYLARIMIRAVLHDTLQQVRSLPADQRLDFFRRKFMLAQQFLQSALQPERDSPAGIDRAAIMRAAVDELQRFFTEDLQPDEQMLLLPLIQEALIQPRPSTPSRND